MDMTDESTLPIRMYRTMRLIRRFEEEVRRLVNANEIAGVAHEYIGQEAVAAGLCAALSGDDILTSTHRGHGHLLARGADVSAMMAELFGRSTGLNRGRGGSMHIADFSLGIYGANGIVAAGAPIAVGAAWARRQLYPDKNAVAVTFFGDGGINQGVLAEAMNMAAIWDLPVIFVCENNQYAVTARITEMSKVPIGQRASSFGMPVVTADGMDPGAVFDAASGVISSARRGEGPQFLECQTYRFVGHQTAEAALRLSYRTDEEIARMRERDPLVTWPARIREEGLMSGQQQDQIDADIELCLAHAIEYARQSPEPLAGSAFDYAYASSDFPGFPAAGWGGRP
ncbi:MAG TPA: thiamine pyrophosphate-dependent dehydrogenase E1 component subunit alpha [Acidimicrobiales bacterium]|nr:thiamine pyrophosphate-dependent dehydrogenase E1 component subunit alpha [Acidimicrobiales bacterium]